MHSGLSYLVFATIFTLYFASKTDAKTGQFLWFTDLFIDREYAEFGKPKTACRKYENLTTGDEIADFGRYGNHSCDTPVALANLMLDSMKKAVGSPDFILFGGRFASDSDFNAGTVGSEAYAKELERATVKVRQSLEKKFPEVKVYLTLAPADHFPTGTEKTNKSDAPILSLRYGRIANKWSKDISDETFAESGYYSASLPGGGTLLSLNTHLWDDCSSEGMDDPGGQLKWLAQKLARAQKLKNNVVIVGYRPLGTFDHPARVDVQLMDKKCNKNALKIIAKYGTTVKAMFFGETHHDSFRLFLNKRERPLNVIFQQTSVVPWDWARKPVAPSFRVVKYSTSTWELEDLVQYRLDLSDANWVTNETAQFEKYYSFKEAYGLSDLKLESLKGLHDEMKGNHALMNEYYHRMSGGEQTDRCGHECRKYLWCSQRSVMEKQMHDCTVFGDRSFYTVLIILFLLLVLIVAITYVIHAYWPVIFTKNEYDVMED